MNQIVEKILNNVNSVVKGKEIITEKILMSILAKGHVLLEDVPGVGKTTMAIAFSKSLGLDTKRIQFTPDTMPSDIVGFSVFDKESSNLVFKPGVVMTNLLLADEINRTSSKTQAALLEVMEEYHVTVDGNTYMLPQPFVVIATQNPVGSAGTTLLPPSQMDRFIIKTSMGYPDEQSQIDILKERHHENPIDKLEAVSNEDELRELIDETANVYISDEIYEYIVKLVEKTRSNELIELGISPRGSLALCRMAKAHAFVFGRDYVTPEDVLSVFDDVCCHRLVLGAKARMNKLTAEDITKDIKAEVVIPQIK